MTSSSAWDPCARAPSEKVKSIGPRWKSIGAGRKSIAILVQNLCTNSRRRASGQLRNFWIWSPSPVMRRWLSPITGDGLWWLPITQWREPVTWKNYACVPCCSAKKRGSDKNFHVVVVVIIIVAYSIISHNLFRSKQENQTQKSNLFRSGVLRMIAVLNVLFGRSRLYKKERRRRAKMPLTNYWKKEEANSNIMMMCSICYSW